jgi:hypothetical protein
MSRNLKLIVGGSLLAFTALALGLVMSVVFTANAGNQQTASTQTNTQSSAVFSMTADEEDPEVALFEVEQIAPEFGQLRVELEKAGGIKGFGKGINANSPEAHGTITQVENGGAKLTINKNRVVNLDANAVLSDANGAITKESLKVGDRVVAVGTLASDKSLTAKTLVRLPALQKALVGDLVSVDANASTLKFKRADKEWTATLNSDAKIYRDGSEVKLADLKTGEKVTVVGYTDDTALTVKASAVSQGRMPAVKIGDMAAGKVKSVDASSIVLKVTDPRTQNTSEVKVTVDANTKYLGNNVTGLSDIKVDDQVVVRGEKQTDGSIKATQVVKGVGIRGGKMMGGMGEKIDGFMEKARDFMQNNNQRGRGGF